METNMQELEFHSNNSPWTEMYAQFCQDEDMQKQSSMAAFDDEQQPTHDALADVYNRD